MYTSKAGRPSSFLVFFWFLPGRDTYVLFSLSTGLFLPDLPLSFSSLFLLSLFPFIIVGRKRSKEDNDNDDDARFCRVYMSGTRSGLYVIIDGVI